MKDVFSRQRTLQIKGIAILLMILHHLFILNDRIYIGYTINSNIFVSGMDLSIILAEFGKICVSIFMFLGGYGLYKTFKKSNFLDKIVNLYKKYWKNFLIFIPIGFIFFSNQGIYTSDISISTKFDNFAFKTIISDFLLLTNNMSGEWWFLKNYFFAIFIGYVYISLTKKQHSVYKEMFIIIVWYILSNGVGNYIGNVMGINNLIFNYIFRDNGHSILFLVGILFSKYKIFNKVSNILEKYNQVEKIIISLIAILLIIYTRVFYFDYSIDVVLTPIFIFFSYELLKNFKKISKIFEFLGKNSTNMWLNHSFFCYYYGFFAKIIYYSNNPLIDFILLTLISLMAALLTDFIWKIINEIYMYFKKIKGSIF